MAGFKKCGGILRFMAIVMLFVVNNHNFTESQSVKNIWYGNIAEQIKHAQRSVNNLSTNLDKECVKKFNVYNCTPKSFIKIPGFDPNWLVRNLSDKQLLADCKKRLTFHAMHLTELLKYVKTNKMKDVKWIREVTVWIREVKTWISSTQRQLGFSTAVLSSRPAKLTSTGAKTATDWYRVAKQLVKNLTLDFTRMRGEFLKRKNTRSQRNATM